jgi:hypothetical protein
MHTCLPSVRMQVEALDFLHNCLHLVYVNLKLSAWKAPDVTQIDRNYGVLTTKSSPDGVCKHF